MSTYGRVERISLLSARLSTSAASAAQRLVGLAALAGLLVAGVMLGAGPAGRRSYHLVPAAHGGFPGWLRGPLAGLGIKLTEAQGATLLVAMSLCYVVALTCARALPLRVALAAVLVLHVAFTLAPPLFSADVFGYIDFARLGPLHGLNPYTHGAQAAPGDSVTPYLRWHTVPSPYGPLFTALGYPLAHLSVALTLWIYKALAGLAGLACAALTWLAARQAGRDPLPATLFVGLNPLLLAYAVGGAHNDLLLTAVVLGAVALAAGGREGLSGAQLVLAAGLKASAGLMLPFLLLGARRRGAVLLGAVGGLTLVGLVAVTLFGHEAFGFVTQLQGEQKLVARRSVPHELSQLFGYRVLAPGVRVGAIVFVAASLTWLLWRTYRGMDWVAAAGWATLAVLIASAWLLPWYVVWALPLAAISGDLRLRIATLAFCAFVVVTHVGAYVS
jgi:hypothetical protein